MSGAPPYLTCNSRAIRIQTSYEQQAQIVTLANHHRIPAIYPLREYVLASGLLSYGASIADAYRLARADEVIE